LDAVLQIDFFPIIYRLIFTVFFLLIDATAGVLVAVGCVIHLHSQKICISGDVVRSPVVVLSLLRLIDVFVWSLAACLPFHMWLINIPNLSPIHSA
jgi:hypothetical protein